MKCKTRFVRTLAILLVVALGAWDCKKSEEKAQVGATPTAVVAQPEAQEAPGETGDRAQLQALDYVPNLAARRQEDDGNVRQFAQAAADLPTVHVGHHDVQQYQIRVGTIGFSQAILCPKGLHDFIAATF